MPVTVLVSVTGIASVRNAAGLNPASGYELNESGWRVVCDMI